MSHLVSECHNTHSLKLNNGEVKQIVETRLPSGLDDLKSTSQLPPTLSTSQLLLKPAVPQELERTVTKHNHVMPQQVNENDFLSILRRNFKKVINEPLL